MENKDYDDVNKDAEFESDEDLEMDAIEIKGEDLEDEDLEMDAIEIKGEDLEDEDLEELSSTLESIQEFEEQEEFEDKKILELSKEEILELRNHNLQIILADKNIENLELKKNILAREKQDVVDNMVLVKKNIGDERGVNISEYLFDLANKRIVHKSLLDRQQ